MNFEESQVTEKTEVLMNRRFIYVFLICLVLSHILHELGHYFTALILGAEFIMYFQSWEVISPLTDTNILIITLAGPIITIILAYIGIFLAEKTEKYKVFGISFAFSNSMIKMLEYIPNLLNFYQGGDEYWIAQIIGMNEMAMYFLFFLILLPPLIYTILKSSKRLLINIFLLFLYVGLSLLLDRLIIFNPERTEVRTPGRIWFVRVFDAIQKKVIGLRNRPQCRC